jgi:hypothetical protein
VDANRSRLSREGVVMPTTEELLAIIDLQVECAELG